MNLKFSICAICVAVYATSASAGNRITSEYTKIDVCKVSEKDKETGAFARKCKGPGGYDIYVLYDDERVSIDVMSPNKERHELNYWDKIKSFSGIYGTIEWRVESGNGEIYPIALISKIYATQQQQEMSNHRRVVFFVISKIKKDSICVTDVIESKGNQTFKEVRFLADHSRSKSCL